MNNFTTSVSRKFKNLAALAFLSIGTLTFQSCSKESGPLPEYAFVNITNTSPTLATFNIYIDQSKINNSGAVAFGGNSGYLTVPSGSHNIKFTTGSSNQALIEKSIPFATNSVSSVFLIDKEANMEYLVVKDELGNSSSDKAFVRFINLSPNAPSLDLVEKEAEVIVSDKAYKTYSSFIEVEAKSYVFQLKNKETGSLIEGGELQSIELKAGKSYTVAAVGLIENSDVQQPFGGKVYTNQ